MVYLTELLMMHKYEDKKYIVFALISVCCIL